MKNYIGTYNEDGTIELPALDLAGNFSCRNFSRVGVGQPHFVMVPVGLAPHLKAEKITAVKTYLAEQKRAPKRKVKDENKAN